MGAAAVLAAGVLVMLPSAHAADDHYRDYAQLAAHETEGQDYRRVSRFPAGAKVAHIAIHGGAIESPTTQLADAAARLGKFAFYSFEGIKDSDNHRLLHITSTHFDEPKAIALQRKVDYTVSWHAAAGKAPTTYVGGLDKALIKKVKAELRAEGFPVAQSAPPELGGNSPGNITNRNHRAKGVQLEISRGQRKKFFSTGNLTRTWVENPNHRTCAFHRYVAAVNRALGITSAVLCKR